MSTSAVWWRAAWVLPVAVGVVALLVGLGLGGAARHPSATKSTVTVTATPTATITRTATPAQQTTDTGTPPGVGPVGDGTFLVGSEIKAGEWSTKGGQHCFWERKKDLRGEDDSVIAKGYITGATQVFIDSSDAAFTIAGGCWWARSGG